MRDSEHALCRIAFGGAWFDAEPEAEATRRELAHIQRASHGLFMVAEAVVLSALLRCGLDVGHTFANSSLGWIEEQLEERRALWERVGASVDSRLPELKAAFRSCKADRLIRSSLENVLTDARSSADLQHAEIAAKIERVRHIWSEFSSVPLLFEFDVDAAGSLSEAHQLFPERAPPN